MTYLSQFPSAKLKQGAPLRPRTNPNKVRAYGPGMTLVFNGFRPVLLLLILLLLLLLLQPFYDPLSGTTQVSRYQKDKPFWILLKQT